MDFRPDLRTRRVEVYDLLLDPNNPRFSERVDDHVSVDDFANSVVQDRTNDRMKAEDGRRYRLDALKDSILANGWQPVDRIFVQARTFGGRRRYVVLEGNRRVAAVKELIRDKLLNDELSAEIDPLEVVEVLGDPDSETVKAQVTYLLGVRHHGSLLPWSPFAQAHDIYERYLRRSDATDEVFRWDEQVARQIAGILGVDTDKVHRRLLVYRVMKQLDGLAAVTAGAGGIKGRYYSVINEVLNRPRKSPLRVYVNQDPETLLVDEPSLARLLLVCHFDVPKRDNAPISSPDEWRAFEKILKDPDSAKRDEMRRRVEEKKDRPSEVYAERAAELRQLRWDRWLLEVGELLRGLQMGELEDADDEKLEAIRRLRATVSTLEGM